MKNALKWIGIVLGVLVVAGSTYVGAQVVAFDRSLAKVYAIPLPIVARSSEPAVLERGKHLSEALGGCATKDCHGADLGGGKLMEMGPLGTFQGPNLSRKLAAYSDGELARLILHGVKRDGRSVLFMTAQDFAWWPDEDIAAVISYLRTVPSSDRPDGPFKLGVLAKVLDRIGMIPLDIARRIDHEHRITAPPPAATAAYGAFVVRLCQGCHGEHLSGGKIPGAPSSLPVPLNLTPHETGLAGWTYEDLDKLITTGVRKNGKPLDAFMPLEILQKFNETEKRALWAYLSTMKPLPFGGR